MSSSLGSRKEGTCRVHTNASAPEGQRPHWGPGVTLSCLSLMTGTTPSLSSPAWV